MTYWADKEKNRGDVKDEIKRNEGITFPEIVENLDISEPTVDKRLKELIEEEEIIKKPNPNDRRVKEYYLSKKEKKKPEAQAWVIYEKIMGTIAPHIIFESHKILEEIKDLDTYKLKEKLKNKQMSPDQLDIELSILESRSFKELNEKINPRPINRPLKDDVLNLKTQLGVGEEEKEKPNKDNLLIFLKKTYLAKGPLVMPKLLSAVKTLIDELTKNMIETDDFNQRRTVRKVIEMLLKDLESGFKPEGGQIKGFDKIIEEVEDFVKMDPIDRFEKCMASSQDAQKLVEGSQNWANEELVNGFTESDTFTSTEIRPIIVVTNLGKKGIGRTPVMWSGVDGWAPNEYEKTMFSLLSSNFELGDDLKDPDLSPDNIEKATKNIDELMDKTS